MNRSATAAHHRINKPQWSHAVILVVIPLKHMNIPRQFSLVSIVVAVSLTCALFAVGAHVLRPAKFYTADQITVHAEGMHDDGIELRFSTLEETMYSCPGVTTEKHDTIIDVYFHRVPLNSKPEVEFPSLPNSAGTHSVKIPFDITAGKPTQIRLNGTKPMGEWTLSD